jgi:serine/threonine protein kinase
MTADVDAHVQALAPGTRFGELEVLGTLGAGGFGIVYLARDHSLEREVAIKEYMPSQFALRDGQSHVSVRSLSMRDTFELGRRSFVNEARLLARFDHPSLLKVYRFWEANGTAYMAMPRLVGQNLREAARRQPTPPPEAWVRRIFDTVLAGLEALHAQQVWHRDVAPDNIFLPADGSAPILLDFGAARQAIGDRTQSFTAILKPSFAPIEQYAEATSLRQGPWTDFYALAAVMHQLLTGHPPQPATARTMADELAPLALPGYAPSFLAALDWALRVPPHQRPQSAAEWRDVVAGRAPVPAAQPIPPRRAPAPPSAPATEVDIEFADTVQGPLPELPDLFDSPAERTLVTQPPPARRGPPWRWIAAAVVLAVLLLGLFAVQLRPKAVEPAPVADLPASAASGPSAQPEAQPAIQPVTQPASQPLVQPAQAPVSAPAAAAAPPSAAASRPRAVTSGVVVAPGASSPATPRVPRRADIITERAGEFHPALPAAIPSAPAVIAPAAAPTAPVASAAAPPAEPRSPAEACGSRILLARAWCIDRQCEKPVFRNDPECVKLREMRDQRNNQGGVP